MKPHWYHILLSLAGGARHGLAVTASIPPEPLRLPRDVATQMLRIVQEALTNVACHAQAAKVDVELTQDRAGVTLQPLQGWYQKTFAWARRPLLEAGLAA